MLNRVIVMGRLTRDPEVKYTVNGTPSVSFSIACERDFSKNGEPRETDFLNLIAWRNTAEFIGKYFRKGSMIAAEGRLQTRKWEDKYQQKRTEVEVTVENVWFGEARAAQGENAPVPTAAPTPRASVYTGDFRPLEDNGDDVPF